jgi:cytochrome c-type biogenesis protein CcmH
LLEEVKNPNAVEVSTRNPLRILALTLLVLLPLLTIGIYYKVGSPKAINSIEAVTASSDMGPVHGQAGIAKLEQKLAENPNDPNVLVMLARSYSDTERWVDSAQAYEKLTKLVPNEAVLWADYADVMAMAHGQLAGAPAKLLEKALALDPENMKALALAGSAAMEVGDYSAAITHWEKLRKIIPAEQKEDAAQIDEGLRQAREFSSHIKGGKPPQMAAERPQAIMPSAPVAATAGKERITGNVALGSGVGGKFDPSDTVFILARAAQGPKMPLAILRKQVKDLPLNFSLDDSMAMAPEMKLSAFDQVVVIARISKSGNAMSQPGDWQGMSAPLKPGAQNVKITIDSPVK